MWFASSPAYARFDSDADLYDAKLRRHSSAAITSSLLKRFLNLLAFILAFQLFIGIPFLAANKRESTLACLLAVVFVVVVPTVLLRRGWTVAASRFLMSSSFLFAMGLMFVTGGVHSPAVVLQITLAVNTPMILGRRWAWRLACACLVSDMALAFFQYNGGQLPFLYPVSPVEALILLTVAVLCAMPVVSLNVDWLGRLLTDRERAVQQVSNRLENLVNTIEGVLWEGDAANFQFRFVSRQAESLLGYPLREWIENPTFWVDHLHPEDKDLAVSFCTQARAEQRDYSFDYRMIASDGRVVWLRDIVTIVQENAQITALRGIMLDVTRQKRVEETLRDSESRYALIAQATAEGIWDRDLVTGESYMSPRWKAILGYRDEELPNVLSSWTERLHPDDAVGELVAREIADPSKNSMSLDHRQRHKDGTYRWIRTHCRIVRDDNGRATRILGSASDVTDQKRAEDELRKQQQRWQLALEATGEGLWELDPTMTVPFRSARWHEQMGYAENELTAMPFGIAPWLHPEDRERVLQATEAYMQREIPRFEIEYRIRAKDGIYRWMQAIGKGLWDEQGKLVRFVVSRRDITNTKEEELKLQSSRQRLRILADLSQSFWENWEDPKAALSEATLKLHPDFADACAIRLVSVDGKWLEIVEGAPKDTDPNVRSFSEKFRMDLPYPMMQSARTGKPVFLPIFDPNASPGPFPPSLMQVARVNGAHSLMILPLRRGQSTVGIMTLVRAKSEWRPFSADDLEFAQDVAARAMFAFDAAQLTIDLRKELAERRALEIEREAMLARLRDLTLHSEEVREEERKRIAREIHDELGQQLTSLKMRLDYLFRTNLAPGRAAQEQALVNAELEHSIRTLRNIATDLRPGVLDSLGLVPALEWLVRDFESKYQIHVHKEFTQLSVNEKTATTIFRVVQEALTNVLKHARASRVSIKLGVADQAISLEVSDDGVGWTEDGESKLAGFGLVGMKERAALSGGSFEILAGEQGGARLRLVLPLPPYRIESDAISARG